MIKGRSGRLGGVAVTPGIADKTPTDIMVRTEWMAGIGAEHDPRVAEKTSRSSMAREMPSRSKAAR